MGNKEFTNKLKGLSLFANVGMAETYLPELGIDIVTANELLEERASFYRHLHPSTNMICGDITNDEVFEKVIADAQSKSVDFVIATPPCQGMSCAGKKDPLDPRNYLIYYAIKAIKRIKPRFVIIENVPMQAHTTINLDGEKMYIPDYVERELGQDYSFNHTRVVNAKDYGVPQSRQRYIYLLSLKSENINWEFPVPNGEIITIRDAIGHLPSLDPLLREPEERWRFPDYERKAAEAKTVSRWHYPPTHSWKQVEWMMHTPSGKSAFKNDIYFPSKNGRRIKGAPRTYMRMDWGKPATTIMQNSGVISTFSTVHPGRLLVEGNDEAERVYSDARTLTIYELLILSSLPTDWNIPDWANETLIRNVIGEGIPPLLIKTAVEALICEGKYDR